MLVTDLLDLHPAPKLAQESVTLICGDKDGGDPRQQQLLHLSLLSV